MAEVQLSHATTRSRLMLELASELVGRSDFLPRQAAVSLRIQGARESALEFFGSDGPEELERVASGEITAGIINPSAMLTVACRGVSPFRGPLPLRALAVIPSFDQLAIAVKADIGITTVEQLAALREPIRISLRGQRTHSVHVAVDHVLQAAGTSLGDLRARGGELFYDEGTPSRERRVDQVRAGHRDAIFDEAVRSWVTPGAEAGLRFLTMSDATSDRLVSWGYRRSHLPRDRYPVLDYDVSTIDFSGFAIYVHADADDVLVTQICEAIAVRRAAIQLSSGEPLPLEEMCNDSLRAPLGVPLHSAAHTCWERLGVV